MDRLVLGALDDLGRRHHGIATYAELVTIGCSSSAISRACRSGLLIRVHRGVYRVVAAPTTWRQATMAAVVASGRGAFAAQRTALALHNLPRTRGGIIEVVAERYQPLRGTQVRTYRTLDLPAADHWMIDGIPVTAIDRSLIDVGRHWDAGRVGSLLDEAVRAQRTTYAQFEGRVHALARSGRNGIGVAREVLAARGFGDGWGFEAAMSRALRRHRLPTPAREWPVPTPERTYHVDFAFPEALLGIECDSTLAHTQPYQFEFDLVRQNAIVREGVLLLRYTPSRLRTDEVGVMAEIEEELRRRSSRFRTQ